jgi:copper chaperone CopZ
LTFDDSCILEGEIMPNKSVNIPSINCGHCIRTIENELRDLDHVISVKADENGKMVDISWEEPQTWDKIKSLLEEINYPVTE